jgi:hypothetical protein
MKKNAIHFCINSIKLVLSYRPTTEHNVSRHLKQGKFSRLWSRSGSGQKVPDQADPDTHSNRPISTWWPCFVGRSAGRPCWGQWIGAGPAPWRRSGLWRRPAAGEEELFGPPELVAAGSLHSRNSWGRLIPHRNNWLFCWGYDQVPAWTTPLHDKEAVLRICNISLIPLQCWNSWKIWIRKGSERIRNTARKCWEPSPKPYTLSKKAANS